MSELAKFYLIYYAIAIPVSLIVGAAVAAASFFFF